MGKKILLVLSLILSIIVIVYFSKETLLVWFAISWIVCTIHDYIVERNYN